MNEDSKIYFVSQKNILKTYSNARDFYIKKFDKLKFIIENIEGKDSYCAPFIPSGRDYNADYECKGNIIVSPDVLRAVNEEGNAYCLGRARIRDAGESCEVILHAIHEKFDIDIELKPPVESGWPEKWHFTNRDALFTWISLHELGHFLLIPISKFGKPDRHDEETINSWILKEFYPASLGKSDIDFNLVF